MIKFRAWDKENEIYLYNVQYAYDTLSGFVKYDDGEDACYDEDCFGGFLNNNRYDVEQFTGLKDDDGKDIYEGDILRLSRDEPKTYIYDDKDNLKPKIIMPKTVTETAPVTKDTGTFGVSVKGVFLTLREVDKGQQNIEAIGNVHENPELLEE
ncbi:YopX family protein [Lactiplantibacillus plantarum]|uniref:YopX family protein n=1 Tax=Lactiplantibacillus plantarum TaxID=1590 RepID=UPI0002BEB634|nr:YopX family protein [Lactiplantibacillus plantarum]EMP45479.1 hypothetical protein H073_01055 [Lactiplantibacillus plantarum UCMA 3037]RDF95365.1 hypothetical protein DQM15_13340 [Lactiplantibacillus plantarum]